MAVAGKLGRQERDERATIDTAFRTLTDERSSMPERYQAAKRLITAKKTNTFAHPPASMIADANAYVMENTVAYDAYVRDTFVPLVREMELNAAREFFDETRATLERAATELSKRCQQLTEIVNDKQGFVPGGSTVTDVLGWALDDLQNMQRDIDLSMFLRLAERLTAVCPEKKSD